MVTGSRRSLLVWVAEASEGQGYEKKRPGVGSAMWMLKAPTVMAEVAVQPASG